MVAMSRIRALHVLGVAGLGHPEDLVPATSATNEVWMTPTHVVRINRRATGRLRREALLAAHLPPGCGHPGVVAAGAGGGIDWVVVRRVPGVPLAHAWPGLDRAARQSAIAQLAERLRLVHATPTPLGLDPLIGPQLLATDDLSPFGPVADAMATARQLPGVPRSLLDEVAGRIAELAGSIDVFDATHLVHGDLTFENVMWDGRRLTALIDFEWARGAPRRLDLDVLLRMCAYPSLHVAEEYRSASTPELYHDVPGWLARAYPELFAGPRLLEQLELFSLTYDLDELVHVPPPVDREAPPLHPVNRLAATLRGRSHLHRWFAAAG
jgi:aminoglycoside phosphotransferase (APT) family kinase protein